MVGKPVRVTPLAANDNTAAAKPAVRRKAVPAAGIATPKSAPVQPASTTRPAPAVEKTTRRPAPVNVTPMRIVVHKARPTVGQKKTDKPEKLKKSKLVRDSFIMPEAEHALIAVLRKRCLEAGVAAKKSEILRAAVIGLARLSDRSVVSAIRRLDFIKTGRPAKESK